MFKLTENNRKNRLGPIKVTHTLNQQTGKTLKPSYIWTCLHNGPLSDGF